MHFFITKKSNISRYFCISVRSLNLAGLSEIYSKFRYNLLSFHGSPDQKKRFCVNLPKKLISGQQKNTDIFENFFESSFFHTLH